MAVKTRTELLTQNDDKIFENTTREITGDIMHDHLEDVIDSLALISEIPSLSTNIYNDDGTLTGNRTVQLDTNDLIFKSSNSLSNYFINLLPTTFEIGYSDSERNLSKIHNENGSLIITDDITNKGIIYNDDYSTNYTDRSLVDKEYVDNQIITLPTITASNGLTKTGDDIQLGGALTDNVEIDTTNHSLEFYGNNPTFSFNETIIGLSFYDNNTDNESSLYCNNDALVIQYDPDGPGNKNIRLDGSDITVNDTYSKKGMIYANDYSANFTKRSLVDKEYVDNKITASNGLTKIGGDDIQLGGVLDVNTTIDGNGNNLNIINAKGGTNIMVSYGAGETLSQVTTSEDTLMLEQYYNGSQSYIELSPTEMSVSDDVNYKGLVYTNDYSGNYTDRSLVDKEYVDNQIITLPTITASNGLTKTGDDIQLGGALTDNVTIDLTTSEYELNFISPTNNSSIIVDGYAMTLSKLSTNYNLTFTPQNIKFDINGNRSFLTNSLNKIKVNSDNILFEGLSYDIDYSANFTNRSLVDKEYVDINKGTLQQVFDASINANNEVYAESGAGIYEDDGGELNIFVKNGGYALALGDESGTNLQFKSDGGVGNPATILLTDNRAIADRHGIEYYADYSAGFTARSLVDKEYVDNKLASGWTGTFKNGDGATVTVTNGLITNVI